MTAPGVRGGPRQGSPVGYGALSGGILAVTHLPGPVPAALLVFVALVPLWLGLDRTGSPAGGARVGAAFGLAFWGLQLAWVPVVALRIGEVWPVYAWMGQVMLLSLLSAIVGGGFVLLRERGLSVAASAVIAWVGVEWARGHLLGPLSFPWGGIALPLARIPVLAQPAAWGGETLLAAGVVAVNASVAAGLLERWGSRGLGRATRVHVLGALGLLALWSLVGAGRLARLDDQQELRARAVVVQPAVSLEEKRGPAAAERAVEALWRGLAMAEGRMEEGGPSLVVFPETHLPFAFVGEAGRGAPDEVPVDAARPAFPSHLLSDLRDWSTRHRAELLVGGYRHDDPAVHNALLRLDSGGVAGWYDKIALVPGVERAPGGLMPGAGPRPLTVVGRAGPLICIESAWSGLARRHARAGAGWLLNVTNDAWLGEGTEASGMTTPAFHQHPWHLILRSVETGLGAIRVANNGWTGSVDPLGRWTSVLPPHRPGVAVAEVRGLPKATVFLRIGDGLGPILLGLLVLVPLVGGLRPTR